MKNFYLYLHILLSLFFINSCTTSSTTKNTQHYLDLPGSYNPDKPAIKLNQDAKLYIVMPRDAYSSTEKDIGSGKRVAEALKIIFSQYCKHVVTGYTPRSLEQSLINAKKHHDDYVIYTQLIDWKKDQFMFVYYSSKLKLSIYDGKTDKLLDQRDFEIHNFTSFFNPENSATSALNWYVKQIFGK